jgi:hypothetical protein
MRKSLKMLPSILSVGWSKKTKIAETQGYFWNEEWSDVERIIEGDKGQMRLL